MYVWSWWLDLRDTSSIVEADIIIGFNLFSQIISIHNSKTCAMIYYELVATDFYTIIKATVCDAWVTTKDSVKLSATDRK